ncbi:CoA transferase [Ramlibacter henchirensis]|uniref:CoA transferase n=1 Tax=Ramlibacter henchirensis TaxID=204072 RepID=A0A4Z0C5I1_9BURK|nr:CoA transferase [Ramlibacter henchirensis]TFZ05369.1 CoA transferase [Ramlibacter henchirensis]
MNNKALEGIRVLDLTNVLAGPLCAYQLALLGADVIKVEVPDSGDLARQLGSDPALNAARMGASFLAQNGGKRSITLNLKLEAGQTVLRRLVASADVLVENFRPGVMERLGLSYEELRKENPSLVYCAITGFGQEGPLRDAPAYDQIIQGLSGMMSVTGDEKCAPLRAGYPVADTISGIMGAFAITAALVRRQRTEEGAFIDVSMLDSALVSMGWVISNYLIAGTTPKPHGNDNFTAAPSGTFRTGEGLLNIAANKQEQFEKLARLVGRPELIEDPRFAKRESRKQNRAALNAELESALADHPASHWEKLLVFHGVPAGAVLSLPQALGLEQVALRGLLQEFEQVPGAERSIKVARTGFKLSNGDPDAHVPPPRLGEHTDEVLAGLGYTAADIRSLKEQGAL